MKSVSVLITVTSVLITGFVVVIFAIETYEFGRDCKAFTKYLDEYDKLYVEYNGKNVDTFCDTFQFAGRGNDFLDEYKVCLDPVYFNDSDCDVTLNIKSGYTGLTDRRITCNLNEDEKYCGSQDKVIYLTFSPTSSGLSRARFKFLVTAKKVYDFSVTTTSSSFRISIGPLVGLVIGGIFLITVVLTVICRCVHRRRPSQGQMLTPMQVQGHAYNYAQYSSQPHQNNAYVFTTTAAAAPMPQPQMQQQTVGATNPQLPASEWSAAPPSYNSVTESSTKK